MPSKRIIILDRLVAREVTYGDQAPQYWSYVLWADVPVTRQSFYANATLTSAVRNIAAADLTALQNGSVVERLRTLAVDKATTVPQLQAILQAEWTAYQTEITAYNPWTRYGTFWDGTTWTAQGVA